MRTDIRLGYAAIALDVPEGSPNATLRAATLAKTPSGESRLYHLTRVARKNLETTLRILRYNQAEGISLYRLTSHLVPFATHPEYGWDWEAHLAEPLSALRSWVRKHRPRLTIHLDHFAVLNSSRKSVREAGLDEVRFQARLLRVLGGPDPVIVSHIGVASPTKEKALARFAQAVERLDAGDRAMLAIENDDSAFHILDALEASRMTGCAVVPDWHHHRVNPPPEDDCRWIRESAERWRGRGRMKVHLSSPADPDHPKAHADDVRLADFIDLTTALREVVPACDVMIEAKGKDRALKALTEQLRGAPGFRVHAPGHVVLDGSPP